MPNENEALVAHLKRKTTRKQWICKEVNLINCAQKGFENSDKKLSSSMTICYFPLKEDS